MLDYVGIAQQLDPVPLCCKEPGKSNSYTTQDATVTAFLGYIPGLGAVLNLTISGKNPRSELTEAIEKLGEPIATKGNSNQILATWKVDSNKNPALQIAEDIGERWLKGATKNNLIKQEEVQTVLELTMVWENISRPQSPHFELVSGMISFPAQGDRARRVNMASAGSEILSIHRKHHLWGR